MKTFLLFAFLGAALAVPVPEPQGLQWPYDNSPYHYGYPGVTKYVYRASIEDDEEPLDRARQDQGSEKQTSVVETGSVAPVPERPGDASSVVNANAGSNSKVPSPQPPNVVKPGVVNPPPFPPKRAPRPPTKPTKPEEEDSDEEDEDDDDESGQDEDEENPEEEEEEEERRRNEPVEVPESVVAPVPENATSIESVEVTAVPPSKPEKPSVVPSDTENVVDAPADEESSDENGSYEGVEAFVPGYVTDQGEVLVPVDTVTGDQPISIVPDPYTPPARGIPLSYYNYNRVGLKNSVPVPVPGRIFRQGDVDGDDDDNSAAVEDDGPVDPEDEGDADDDDDDDNEDEEEEAETKKPKKSKKNNKRPPLAFVPATSPTNEDDELESALRYRSEAFPPSRSPMLLPVTFRYNGGYLTGPFKRPVSSAEVFQYLEPSIKYSIQQRTKAPSSPAMNIFAPYMGNNQYESSIVLRKPSVQMPVTYGYTAQTRRPVSRRPMTPMYVKSGSTPSQYMPVYYSEPLQYPGPIPHPSKLHNPGEKLKIKSSYELLVEPPTDVVKYKTKSKPSKKKRPNNKRRPVPAGPVVLKTKVSRPGVVVAKKPSPVLLSRPVYNVQPHTRVPVRVRPVTPYYVVAPPRPMSPYYSRVQGPVVPSAYYNGFRPMRNPTQVVYQDEPADSGSDESVPEERRPKWKREMKKPAQEMRTKKTKKPTLKQADRLGLFVKPTLKKRTSVNA